VQIGLECPGETRAYRTLIAFIAAYETQSGALM
jgi:hypothetical protein